VHTSSIEQKWRSHSNAICKHRVAKHDRTTRVTETHSNIDEATPIRFTRNELQKTMELRAQQQGKATVTQPLQRKLQHQVTEGKRTTMVIYSYSQFQNRMWAPKPKKVRFWSLFKTNPRRIMKGAKIDKNIKNSLPQPCRNWMLTSVCESKLSCETSVKKWKLMSLSVLGGRGWDPRFIFFIKWGPLQYCFFQNSSVNVFISHCY